jgi:HSP20 family protein
MSDRNAAQKTRYVRPYSAVNEAKDGKLQVVLEMPGVGRENLDVRVENNELRIGGRRPGAAEGKYILRERSPGDFLQTYTLDETVDPSKIDAVLEKGILTLTLELKDHVRPRRISVRGE